VFSLAKLLRLKVFFAYCLLLPAKTIVALSFSCPELVSGSQEKI
jgi:hypothetical protein